MKARGDRGLKQILGKRKARHREKEERNMAAEG